MKGAVLIVPLEINTNDTDKYAKAAIQQGVIMRMAREMGLEVQIDLDRLYIDALIEGTPEQMKPFIERLARSPYRKGQFTAAVTGPDEQAVMQQLAEQYPVVIGEVVLDN